jgi:SET domain-containing protein
MPGIRCRICEAIRDIASGEELAYDYDFILPVRRSPAMKKCYPCSCGAFHL